MPSQNSSLAMFDLAALALIELTADGRQLANLEVYPSAVELLCGLHKKGVTIQLVFSCGAVPADQVQARLRLTGLEEFADCLVAVSRYAGLRDTFKAAAAPFRLVPYAGEAPLRFVGVDAAEREIAASEGFRTAPHPLLALGVIGDGGALRYLRIRVPAQTDRAEWTSALRELAVVPIHITVEPAGSGTIIIYAIADTRTAAALDYHGFWVDRLGAPSEPETTTAYLIRDDLHEQHGFMKPGHPSNRFLSGPAASGVLASTHEGILVALSPDTPVKSLYSAEAREGHGRALSPSRNLLWARDTVAPRDTRLLDAAVADPLSSPERDILRHHFDPVFMKSMVETYIRLGSDESAGPYGSRHFEHRGNHCAVDLLVRDFGEKTAGRLPAKQHCFTHGGVPATNVVATLEATAGMDREGVVLVCAHLDTFPGSGATALSPGADDDASGMAAVLAASVALLELAPLRTRRREIRFVLFNCEEVGKTGSEAYAYTLAELGVGVAAMYQMDMIGYDHRGGGNIQAHVGFNPAGVPNGADAKRRSAEQAQLIEHLRPIVTSLTEVTQIYTSAGECGNGRSDHTKFHAVGYPGCWVSENLFACGTGCHVLNPAYHKSDDTVIDERYAAEIARLVAAAAWIAATR